MAESDFTDNWLTGTLEELLGAERLEEVRQAEPQETLWETVVAAEAATDGEILAAVAGRFRFKLADFALADRQSRELVPETVARRYHIIPIRVTDSHLEIATANPFDLDCEKTLAFATGREIRTVLASPTEITNRLEEFYRPENVIDQLLEGLGTDADIKQLEDEAESDDLTASAEEASQRPVVRLVDVILSEGILSRASDIHIEPEEGGVAVRYRIDGVLREVMKIPRGAGLPLISRFKIIAALDIADRLRPQDGRARVAVNGQPVDLRISTLPASVGEKVVVRILDSRNTVLSLDSLGLAPEESSTIRNLLDFRDGIILVTGPTGSGKTTTLYSALNHVQNEGVNIVTVEDPVEYRMQGIVQVQVHEKAGLTFASALRSILRQDPDVVLVGEIRDKETAQIAVQASLTGHLVLSTLHTNDAPNAVTRLLDIGMEAFKIGSALRGVVAQRLMRRLCPTCSEPVTDPPPEKLRRWIPEGANLRRGVGCPECAMTGYRGRFSIVEVLPVTDAVEAAIVAGETADKLARRAQEEGMKTLWDSGLRHVLAGESTIEELLRVVDMPAEHGKKPLPPLPGTDRKSGERDQRRSGGGERRDSRDHRLTPSEPQPAASGRSAAPLQPVQVVVSQAEMDELRAAYTRPSRSKLEASFDLIDADASGAAAVAEGERGSVLLVDDEDQLRKVMADLLGRDGYSVIEAKDGVEAIEQIDRHAPDIIVLDLNLPGLDGYAVLSQLRSRPATQDIPIIVLTAKGDEDNEVRVFELGADDFMSKPFRAKALSARLSALLARSKRK